MKKYIVGFLVFSSFLTHAQIGIGTTTPTSQLDVNGDLRVRATTLGTGLEAAKDSILVINYKGVVKRVTSKQIYDSHIKSFVKGSASGTINLGTTISATAYKTIPFSTEEFDENSDYNTTTYQFTAPQNGIYNVYVQYELTTLVATTGVGVAIFVQRSGTNTLEAEEIFDSINISVLTVNVNVSPPTRKTSTLVKLNAGDKIFFGAAAGTTISLLSGSKSFFTIMQVK
ncbi:C1q-like domain-containing protein [Flavobacterium sp. RSP15]|uniref:C1q-like domain-containing protein n=1 Tax=Flavobacterium sp. RSP15 TaxID=2497485 RepID=UPI000F8301B4|nr:hypothetical protein [Flavobacterium sp. RSP15]RTY88862.1 hypothetical protein EKM00_01545 [Flavobacterium sp. RSP15]